jgi:hypothetical protein
MDRPLHPWLKRLHSQFGEHPDYDAVAKWVHEQTGREFESDSLRLIAQGHRPPGWDFALDLEAVYKKRGFARELREWPHYTRVIKRAA